MTKFDSQYQLQGGRCWLCQAFTLPQNMNRAHLVPKSHDGVIGEDWQGAVLMHPECNESMKCLHAGSIRFQKWIKRVVKHGKTWPFIRRETFTHNAT